MNDLERTFEAAMWRTVQEAKKIGYHPAYFIRMLDELGGLAAAKRLINASTASDGFTRLWELKRLDLAVEAVALDPQYRSLFTSDELTTARRRLREYGFEPG